MLGEGRCLPVHSSAGGTDTWGKKRWKELTEHWCHSPEPSGCLWKQEKEINLSLHFSNSLLSHEGVEIVPDRMGKEPAKGQGESISPLTIHLALQSVKNHLISFVKVCFSIIANYSSTVLQPLKMVMGKHTCFYSEEHPASVTFQSSYGNHYLAECDSGVWQGKPGRMRSLCSTALIS